MKWNTLKTAIMLIICHMVLSAGLTPVQAAVHDVQTAVQERTKEDIRKAWRAYIPTALKETNLFVRQPDVNAPFRFGQVKKEVLEDGLKAVNFVRYLAGLPDDIRLDYDLTEQQQAGAILLAHIGGDLNHEPTRPVSMPYDIYELGYAATSSSNLAAGYVNLYEAIMTGYMPEREPSNVPIVGHRRWILNPYMQTTMFGLAYNPDSYYGLYSTMYAFNADRDPYDIHFEYVAWPSAGYFPLEVFDPLDPWSVSLNTAIYDNTRTDKIIVKVTSERERDTRFWRLEQTDNDLWFGNFMNVETSFYGLDFAIIFRPGDIDQIQPGDRYHVQIDNLYMWNSDQPISLSYTTEFFQLASRIDLSTSRPHYMAIGDTYQLPVSGDPVSFTSSNPYVASVDENGLVTAHGFGYVRIDADDYFYRDDNAVYIQVESPLWTVSEWAEAEIKEAAIAGMMTKSPFYMNLTGPISRREFVNLVVDMLTAIQPEIWEEMEDVQPSPFADVHNLEQAILWAYENGLINGTGNGRFSPNDLITREQAATLLMRIYRYLGGEESGSVKASEPFADESQIAAWAKEAVQEAKAYSIMNGVSGNRFDPRGTYSKEQTIVTLYRLYKQFR